MIHLRILNINFTSINADREGVPQGNVKVNNNLSITNLEEANLGLEDTKKGIKITFSSTTQFEPDIAEIVLDGEMTLLGNSEEAQKLLDTYEEKGTIHEDYRTKLLNNMMNKCSLESILISRELNLPSPVPLPKMKKDQ